MKLGVQITTDGQTNVIELSGDGLAALQRAVDGYVECIALTDTFHLWVNEEGKLDGSEFNPHATMIWERVFGETDVILGDVVLTGGVDSEGEVIGLTDTQIARVRQWVAEEQVFIS